MRQQRIWLQHSLYRYAYTYIHVCHSLTHELYHKIESPPCGLKYVNVPNLAPIHCLFSYHAWCMTHTHTHTHSHTHTCLGETGVGKSTLIDSLFKTNFPGERDKEIFSSSSLYQLTLFCLWDFISCTSTTLATCMLLSCAEFLCTEKACAVGTSWVSNEHGDVAVLRLSIQVWRRRPIQRSYLAGMSTKPDKFIQGYVLLGLLKQRSHNRCRLAHVCG